MNHDKELDKTNIQCRFRNLTLFEKDNKAPMCGVTTRLFFNKYVLPLGQVFIKVGDIVDMIFYVPDPNAEEDAGEEAIKPFSSYQFMVAVDGFQMLSGMGKDELLPQVKTWEAQMTSIALNFIEDGTMGLTTQGYNA